MLAKIKVLLIALVVVCSVSGLAMAQWSLSGDMPVTSNPSPPIAGVGGDATWSYHCGGACDQSVSGNLVGVVNGEMPNEGTGWYFGPGNHHAMISFSVDANPIPPLGDGDDKTTFDPVASGVAQVGGHSNMSATWTAQAGFITGDYNVNWLGYNARNQSLAAPHEQGRTGPLALSHNGNLIDEYTLAGGVDDGYAGRYSNGAVLSLSAGDTVEVAIGGGEWHGLDLSITPVPEPTSVALLVMGLTMLGLSRRQR